MCRLLRVSEDGPRGISGDYISVSDGVDTRDSSARRLFLLRKAPLWFGTVWKAVERRVGPLVSKSTRSVSIAIAMVADVGRQLSPLRASTSRLSAADDDHGCPSRVQSTETWV